MHFDAQQRLNESMVLIIRILGFQWLSGSLSYIMPSRGCIKVNVVTWSEIIILVTRRSAQNLSKAKPKTASASRFSFFPPKLQENEISNSNFFFILFFPQVKNPHFPHSPLNHHWRVRAPLYSTWNFISLRQVRVERPVTKASWLFQNPYSIQNFVC